MLTLSVVVISYNSSSFLEKNIRSLLGQSKKFKQIIIVDNNSTDNSREIIKEYDEVSLVAPGQNVGYAAGANLGISECRSDLILVANSDIYLESDFNENVISKFEEDRKISLLSPLILRFDKMIVDSAGQMFSRSLYPVEIGFNRDKNKLDIKERSVFSVCGAATVFRKNALEKLKVENEYYDEAFFMFWEDFDIGWRANLYGMKTIMSPTAIVYHFRGGTLKKNFTTRFSMALSRSPEIKYHLIKNRYLTLIKNFRFKKFWYLIPFVIFKDIIWVGMLTMSSPKIIIKLFSSGGFIISAFRKRKIIKKNE